MLEIKDLQKKYTDHLIFKNLALTIPTGKIMAIVGPSGIGKTTFLKIIAGLLPADQGTMELNGERLDLTGNRKGAQVGVIFQDFNLFPQYTVQENITLAPINVLKDSKSAANKKAEELLKELGLFDQASQYPNQLSGGQKQRVAIARALAMQPGMLAYDEPTSGLDAASTQQVVHVMQQMKSQGVTQLVVTHDLPFAEAVADLTFDFGKEVQR
ncbi:amino acid ABC transporter ATP-binding protein [Weissella koreensis]|uniref:Amino acid ABC transporter ATP-binding protein n=1 Tax=Weissella koreensis TaxID=165096 RepID=A0A7H1MN64_9LACO|nr:ATP-binding cassette domain-containing protein [Weissella koreensis]AVH75698.1 amino acid ABC transporter ATP-binding protein [Weissella koreensis]EJF34687.1 ABC superfamily ATP binding cassette transporter, ABC protein [Weissella koreensis KCTC 3621]QGN20919.1 ATP-binding cassette domain-containing protein [Weissella koreensis]QNT64900.1 amino acid ABC transporter ATP-binding protein [Weissella koreensis]